MKEKCAECHFYTGANFCAHCGRPTKGAALESEEVVAEGWVEPGGLADYNAGRERSLPVHRVQTLYLNKAVRILAAKEEPCAQST